MSIADELRKLEELHRAGSLNDAEFAQAKAKVLAGTSGRRDEAFDEHLAGQLAEVHHQNELARLDREWELDRQKYLITSRYGWRQVPTKGMGIGIALVGGVFGLLWTVIAFSITSSGPDFGAFAIAKFVFPLFGVVFVLTAIGYGAYCYNRA